MPLLRVLQRIARAEAVTRADIFDAPSEQLIAHGRCVVCLLLLLATLFEPMRVAVSLLLIAYAIFSAILVALTQRQFLNRTAQQLIHLVDVTVACLLLFFAEASAS